MNAITKSLIDTAKEGQRVTLPDGRTVMKRTIRKFSGTVIVADISGSMNALMPSGKTRHGMLRDALIDVYRPGDRLVSFSGSVCDVSSPDLLLDPQDSTAMHLAFPHIASPAPTNVIVISDGGVDDEDAALKTGWALKCKISAVFIGDDRDKQAIGFLDRLCHKTGGTVTVRDLMKLLTNGQAELNRTIRGLLTHQA